MYLAIILVSNKPPRVFLQQKIPVRQKDIIGHTCHLLLGGILMFVFTLFFYFKKLFHNFQKTHVINGVLEFRHFRERRRRRREKRTTTHSSEIRGLCQMKFFSETLHNLPYILLEYENPCSFFRLSFRAFLYKIARNEKQTILVFVFQQYGKF